MSKLIENLDENNIDFPYMIAEIGLNHNGSRETALKLVDAAKNSKCDAVKFQLRSADILELDPSTMEIGEQYVHSYICNTFINYDVYEEIFKYSRSQGLEILASAWDIKSVEFAKESGIEVLKIASADLTNNLLITRALELFDYFVVSTGMSSENEIDTAIKMFIDTNKKLSLLHCQSAYPAPLESLNLKYITRLKGKYPDITLGYSGHELEYHVCLAAYSLGARIFEKHITLDKNSLGNDHKVSLYQHELENLNKMLKDVHTCMGSDCKRVVSPGEKINRISLSKSLCLNRSCAKGHVIRKRDLDFCFGGRGIKPDEINNIIGQILNRDMSQGKPLEYADFIQVPSNGCAVSPPILNNLIPGIPVRYHDAVLLSQYINTDYLEFHLSYKDMLTRDFSQLEGIKEKEYSILHTFHAPDFYEGDHIFDPINDDKEYSKRSKKEFVEFLLHVQSAIHYLGQDVNTEKTKIITSFSTCTLNELKEDNKKDELYFRLAEFIYDIEQQFPRVQILPQTLPVNAWYLGGRRFVNTFAKPSEIEEFCVKYDISICLDTAHTIMASNYYGTDPNQAILKLLNFTSHMHLVDAKGIFDEGLSFGEGDLNLKELVDRVGKLHKTISYIPEIWQGHHNNGQGFINAFEQMQSLS